MFTEPVSMYVNDNLLDGSQPGAVTLFMRAIEWAGGLL
jgi:hypothetical protein